MVVFGVLGPLTADNEHGPVTLKGPRHRAVLARLLVAGGRVVPVHRLIDDLWLDAPDGALGAVQTFVGALRKALEPDRPPRTPARVLVTVAPGYALRADDVDARRFEAAVAAAADLPPEQAVAVLDEALALWRGPAYAEFAEEHWARGEAARLDELRLLAVARRAEAALALGQAAESVPELEAHVAGHPLREDGWRLLALALYRTGRQGDALATLRRAREVLRTELGVDPGEELRRLEADILAQDPRLTPPAPVVASGQPFVGRAEELASLERAAADAAAGRPRLALVSGAAGAGKTALATTLGARLAAAGWTVAWGASPEPPGAPAGWPWARMRETLGPEPDTDTDTTDPVTTRFRRHRAICAHVAAVAARAPVLLVFDDLHWADEETLALVTALATDPGGGRVLLIGTYRSTEISPELAEALGRAARAEPTRIYLGGLTEPQVRELVEAVAYREVPAADAQAIHARSGGNPFYVRELTRLWETDPAAVLHTVPAGVRDVIRRRLAALPETARAHLRQAAVLGQDVDLDVLVPLAGDEDAVLDSVEAGLLAGFLVEEDGDRLRFAHALVHDTLYDDVPRARRARWHAAVADLVDPDDVETVAHHLLRAGARADPARTAHYAHAAATRAEQRFAPHEAARLWRAAVDLAEAGRPRLTAVMGLVRALAVTGDLPQSRRLRAEAAAEAEALGDPLLTAEVLGAFDVPAIWTANDDEALSARLVAAAERTLAALPEDRAVERARLLVTIAMERRADPGRRGDRAAREAEAVARRLGDPTLLAYALNGRFMQTFHRAGLAPERAAIGAELLDLATEHGLVTFEVLARLILLQAGAALGDLATADHHAEAVGRLGERYEIPLVGVFTEWYGALRLAVTGRRAEARAAYRAAAARLSGAGMPGMASGLLPLALLCLDQKDPPADADWGPYEPWARPLVLLAAGDRAGAAACEIPDSPRDLLFEARTCLHALVALELGDRPRMAALHEQLLPAAGELAGAGSGLVTLGPTARYLDDLAAALDKTGTETGT